MRSNKNLKSLADFERVKIFEDSMVKGVHDNCVKIVRKKSSSLWQIFFSEKYTNLWFLKKPDSKTTKGKVENINEKILRYNLEAQREVIAQEFLRLLFSYYPKTRLLKKKERYYVLSKGVPGFKPVLTDEFKTYVQIEKITGLGYVLFGGCVVQEIDLKFENMCLDSQNRLIKYDGGWCFASLVPKFSSANYEITEKEIDALPYLDKRYSFNWLGLVVESICYEDTSTITARMALDGHKVREEVNQAILFFLMLPIKILEIFLKQYPIDGELRVKIFAVLSKNRADTRSSALKNESFCKYIITDKAEVDFANQLLHYKAFTTTSKNKLSDHVEQFEEIIRKEFLELRKPLQLAQMAFSQPSVSQAPNYAASSRSSSSSTYIASPDDYSYSYSAIAITTSWNPLNVSLSSHSASSAIPSVSQVSIPVAKKPVIEIKPQVKLQEITLGITEDQVVILRKLIANEVKEAIKASRSVFSAFSFIDRKQENIQIAIWSEVEVSKNFTSIITQAVLVYAITKEIEATAKYSSELNKNSEIKYENISLGRIYQAVAKQLIGMAPDLFKEILKEVAIKNKMSDISNLLKNIRHRFSKQDIVVLNSEINLSIKSSRGAL